MIRSVEWLVVPFILDEGVNNFLSSVANNGVDFMSKSFSHFKSNLVVGFSFLFIDLEDFLDGVVDRVGEVLREVSHFEWVFIDVSV